MFFYKRLSPLHSIEGDEGDKGGGGGGGEGDKGGGGEGDKGGGDETWHSKLPDELKAEPSLVDFKDESEMIPMPVNVAKSFVHTKKLVGADVIKMPATDEERMELYNKLGRPETDELYVLQAAADINPVIQKALDKDTSWFRKTAHELGLSDTQATALYAGFSKQMSDKHNETMKFAEQDGINTEIKLRTEYGTAYDGKKVLAQRAMQEIGGPEFMNLINTSGINKNPAFIRAMFKVGDMMAEDLGLDKSTGILIQSKASVQEEISSLMAQKAYLDGAHPEHKSFVQKVATLTQQLHGVKPIPETVTGVASL